MPADNRSRRHQDKRLFPSRPKPAQQDPEQLVPGRESPARSLGVESQELLTKSEVFQDQILAGTECGENPASEVSEPHDQGKNLTQVRPVEPVAKSLYLQVHHVLRTHNPTICRYKIDPSCGHEKTTGKRSRQTSTGTWRFCLKLLRSLGSSGHRVFSTTLYHQRLQPGAWHRAERLEAIPWRGKSLGLLGSRISHECGMRILTRV